MLEWLISYRYGYSCKTTVTQIWTQLRCQITTQRRINSSEQLPSCCSVCERIDVLIVLCCAQRRSGPCSRATGWRWLRRLLSLPASTLGKNLSSSSSSSIFLDSDSTFLKTAPNLDPALIPYSNKIYGTYQYLQFENCKPT